MEAPSTLLIPMVRPGGESELFVNAPDSQIRRETDSKATYSYGWGAVEVRAIVSAMEEQRRLIDVIVDDQELVSQIMDEFYKRLSEGPEEELDFKAIIDGS